MNERLLLGLAIGCCMLCEAVDGRGGWSEHENERGDVVVTIFEITIVAVLVACCVGMFQQYDGWGYLGWNGAAPYPPPPPPFVANDACSYRITMDDIRRTVSREVEQRVRQEMEKGRLQTVHENGDGM